MNKRGWQAEVHGVGMDALLGTDPFLLPVFVRRLQKSNYRGRFRTKTYD